jgi:flagellar basal-body rod modification protein FlgD
VAGIIPISSVTNPTHPSTAIKPKNELDKDSFMKLLVAQLKNQNPMEPSDPSAFMAQTSQMTMVEKLEQMVTNSTAALQVQQSMTAAAMVGRQITWNGDDGTEQSGVVNSAKLGSAGSNLVVGTGNNAKTIPLTKVLSVGTAPTAAPA